MVSGLSTALLAVSAFALLGVQIDLYALQENEARRLSRRAVTSLVSSELAGQDAIRNYIAVRITLLNEGVEPADNIQVRYKHWAKGSWTGELSWFTAGGVPPQRLDPWVAGSGLLGMWIPHISRTESCGQAHHSDCFVATSSLRFAVKSMGCPQRTIVI